MHGKNDGTESRWTRIRRASPTGTQALTILFVALLVASVPGPFAFAAGMNSGTAEAATTTTPSLSSASISTTTATTDDNTSYYDDFSDGNVDGWNSTARGPRISDESFWGNHSLNITDDDIDTTDGVIRWTDGPTFDTQANFEISGTFKADEPDQYRYRIGIGNNDSDKDGAVIVLSKENNATYLVEDWSDDPPEQTIENPQWDTWLQFRLKFDSGEAQAKVWAAGTEEPDDWQLYQEYDSFEGKFIASPGQGDANRRLQIDQVDAGGHVVSGQFLDSSGEPVANATVEGYGVDYAAVEQRLEEQSDDLNVTAEELREEADRLMDEAEGAGELPEEWQNFETAYGSDDLLDTDEWTSNVDGTYPLVHHEDDWGGGISNVITGSSVDDPRIQHDGDGPVVITLWDPSEEGRIENQIDGSYLGRTASGEITVRELDPGGGFVDTTTYETSEHWETTNVYNTKQHHGVKVYLSDGLYQAYPAGQPEKAYTFQVGDAKSQWTAFETELENRADELNTEADQIAQRAQTLTDNINVGEMERRTVTTDENGTFEIRFQTGVERAAIQGYRADGTVLTDITGPSFDDLRDVAESGYNGTYVLSAPTRHAVPTQDVVLEGYRADELPQHPLEDFNDFLEWKNEQILNETVSELKSEYDKRFEEMNRTRLEGVYQTHRPLIETVPSAQERYLNSSTFDEVQDAADLSKDELATETDLMQQALRNVGEIEPEVDDPSDLISIEDGELFFEYPLPDGVDTDDLPPPEIHWVNGESETVPDEYWSVESRDGLTGGQQLVIDGYPISADDPAAFDIRVQAASSGSDDVAGIGGSEGGLLDDRISATNPNFAGVVPDVRAIDVSTLSPGASEQVSLNLRTGDGGDLESLEAVEVFGPDGSELSAEVTDSDSARFTTNGAGEHFVRATYNSSTGDQFVRTFSLRALEEGRNNYATVRAERATGDEFYALAGDGLRDAEIAVENDRVGISAVAPSGETPARVDVKAAEVLGPQVANLDLRVLEGAGEHTIESKVETVIHFDSLDEDAIMWRGEPSWVFGQPLERGEAERYGEVLERESGKVVIRTYTEEDGSLSLYVNENPTTGQSIKYSVATSIPSVSLWWLPAIVIPSLSGLAAGAAMGLLRRRHAFLFR